MSMLEFVNETHTAQQLHNSFCLKESRLESENQLLIFMGQGPDWLVYWG